MDGQGHQSNQHEFDPTPGGSGRQEGLACSGPWGHEQSDTTKRLNDDDDSPQEDSRRPSTLLSVWTCAVITHSSILLRDSKSDTEQQKLVLTRMLDTSVL